MKTAEEWRTIISTWHRRNDGLPSDTEIQAIQLDAYKAGMSEAAKMRKHRYEHIELSEFRKAILSARDRKTSL